MLVLKQRMCISKAGHLNLKHVWAEYKDANVSDSHRNIWTSCNLKQVIKV